MTKVYHQSDNREWETPPEVFAPLDVEFDFGVDVCATEENTKCSTYYSKTDVDIFGNTVTGIPDWTFAEGPAWMNPPYGLVIGDWIQQAYDCKAKGMTTVCLVPARTDTKWWSIFYDHANWRTWDPRDEIRFVKGRIKFVGARASAPFPSAIIVLRGNET